MNKFFITASRVLVYTDYEVHCGVNKFRSFLFFELFLISRQLLEFSFMFLCFCSSFPSLLLTVFWLINVVKIEYIYIKIVVVFIIIISVTRLLKRIFFNMYNVCHILYCSHLLYRFPVCRIPEFTSVCACSAFDVRPVLRFVVTPKKIVLVRWMLLH